MVLLTEKKKENLSNYLNRNLGNKLPIWKVLERAIPLANALLFMQRKGIFHKNLCPENILYDEDGNLCLTDVGIPPKIETHARYCSPEVIKGMEYSSRSDVYQFAMILWEMITYEQVYSSIELTPFDKKERIEELLEGKRPDIDRIPVQFSYLRNFLQLCWSEIPDKRPGFDTISLILQNISSECKYLEESTPTEQTFASHENEEK